MLKIFQINVEKSGKELDISFIMYNQSILVQFKVAGGLL